jgi:2-haloacid dehalogenase
MNEIKALTFDTGGTILDWHSGVKAKLVEIGSARGIEADWAAVTNEYRMASLLGMTSGETDFSPNFNIDHVHREAIQKVIEANGISAFTDDDYNAVRDVWHGLECWPDVPGGIERFRTKFIAASLTILSVRLIIDTCKPAGIVWDTVISCEMMGVYKPRELAYRRAAEWLQLEPSECLMVAAHNLDLAAAAKAGFKTAFVKRPMEWGNPGEPDFMKNDHRPDFTAENFEDLANQLDC